jgi:hypothetical protein
MNIKLLGSVGAISLAATSILASTDAAEAAKLGVEGQTSKLSVDIQNIIFFNNNVLDFTPNGTFTPSLGTAGDFRVSTPPNPIDPESGIFGQTPLSDGTGRQFVGSLGKIEDLFVDPSDIPAPGFLENDRKYLISELQGGATEIPILRFDTDGDGQYGEASGVGSNALGDFVYFISALTRRVTQNSQGAFDVSFDFEGFFIDKEGKFEKTESIISIFNGTSTSDPEKLTPVTAAAFMANPNNRRVVASADGTITTDAIMPVPEPSTLMGIGAILGLGGLLKKQKKNA